MTLAEIPMHELLAEISRRKIDRPTCRAAEILNVVCNACNVTMEDVIRRNRTRRLCDARMIATTVLATKFPNWSLQDLASFIGMKAHSSTKVNLKRCTERYNEDSGFRTMMKNAIENTKGL